MRAILDEYQPSIAVFVDDLGHQHQSVAEHAPEVFRLHMIGEPRIARTMPKAKHAHERIDHWPVAQRWIMDRFQGVPL